MARYSAASIGPPKWMTEDEILDDLADIDNQLAAGDVDERAVAGLRRNLETRLEHVRAEHARREAQNAITDPRELAALVRR